MESAFAWFGNLMEWFGQFIPRREIVDTTYGAVKFIRGHKVKALGPGLHFYWPLTTKFVTYPTARQATDLRNQTLMTTDGRTIMVGGLIVYEIKDIVAILANTYDPEQTIKDVALSAIHDVMVRMTWEDVQAAQEHGTLALRLRKRVRKELDKYGVKVLKVALTDLSPVRVFRLVQSQAQDGL